MGAAGGLGSRGVSPGPSRPRLKLLPTLRAEDARRSEASANSALMVLKQKPKTIWGLGCAERALCLDVCAAWVGRPVRGAAGLAALV